MPDDYGAASIYDIKSSWLTAVELSACLIIMEDTEHPVSRKNQFHWKKNDRKREDSLSSLIETRNPRSSSSTSGLLL